MENCNHDKKCGGRREFLVKASALAGGVVLSLSGLTGAEAQTENRKTADAVSDELVLKLDAASPLSKIGGSQTFDTKSGKVVVVRGGEMSFAAFSTKCTHKGGPVSYDEKSKQLVCQWHGSKFDSNAGSVLNGPATEPLPAFATESAVVVSLKPKS